MPHSESYAAAALDRECAALAGAGAGRNDQLNRSAYSMGQFVGAGSLDKSEVTRRLLEAAQANGYVAKDGESAARSTISSGLEKGIREPRPASYANGRGSPREVIHKKPAPRLTGVSLPNWTPPNDKGDPPFIAVGQDQPPLQKDETRRHLYERDAETVRCKIKKGVKSWLDFYRVRCPETGDIGWQWKKPAGYVAAPYVADGDPFNKEFAADVLFWPEGEKDVETLARHGLCAFTFGGSSDVPEQFDALKGRDLVILADNDAPGATCATKKAEAFAGVAARVRILTFDEKDVSDFFATGGSIEDLWAKVDQAPIKPRPRPLVSATPFIWRDPKTLPPREWIYRWHYIRRFVSCTVSPGGIGKSSLVIGEALAIASGRPLLGTVPAERTAVWYWNGEDPQVELDKRLMAAVMFHDLKSEDIDGKLFVDSGRTQPLIVAIETRDGARIAEPIVEGVKNVIRDRGIGLLIIDPFISCHEVKENDNPAIQKVATIWAHIAEETGCAIELVHHSKKTGGAQVTVEDGRGASALIDKCRAARALNPMTEEEAKEAGVEDRRTHFRSYDGKLSLAPPSDKSTWFKLESVDLGNETSSRPSDHLGVATAWSWPDPLQSVSSVADLRAVQQKIAAGSFRENAQAEGDWVGKVIADQLDLDAEDKKDRKEVKKILSIWITSGALKIVMHKDDQRRDRKFVEVGEWAS